MRRTQFLTRPAYALAIALASLGAVGVIATPAQAQKKDDKKAAAATKAPQPTKTFIPAYTELKTMLDAAAKRPDVIAAKAKVTETERAYRSAVAARRRKLRAASTMPRLRRCPRCWLRKRPRRKKSSRRPATRRTSSSPGSWALPMAAWRSTSRCSGAAWSR
ncbi:MAG: hypothetical protein LW689_11965 [Novosphingobium sp.]|nr:hypothetical protein [Novosphingobium sp.]